ncbi:ribulokinase [[Pasteurella] mairii]|uniref:Ribulokinase n=1 Tax=[Pasteurella] mairii TaxID=757 RepID=A0A379B7Z1_9PAST|nr:ribulokinase [[Pasteurella] mairii]
MKFTKKNVILNGQGYLGIELGSTRIKSVLIDKFGNILAKGSFEWQNDFVGGIWTYPLDKVWQGIASSYRDLCTNIKKTYSVSLQNLAGLGVSAMMHGYIPFDKEGNQIADFRTWRNNTTAQAADQLTEAFQYNIPYRWSIAHLYQAILNGEEHTKEIAFFTTLAGYVHWQLSSKKVLGIGDASGMFPIDIKMKNYDQDCLNIFNQLIKPYHFNWQLSDILPQILTAGSHAGVLTEKGAKLLDPTGYLQAGCMMSPPEGDAGTGMMATNSITARTGNISAGTSAFAMVVLEKPLSKLYRDLDRVTTPSGDPVAMAHSQNCSSALNAWMQLFNEVLCAFKLNIPNDELYNTLFQQALKADPDGGNLLSYGFYSGEHAVDLVTGCPLFLHPMKANFTLANFILIQLYTSFAAMKLGIDTLIKTEGVQIDKIFAHGGLFKSKEIVQKVLASALNVPVSIIETASEGGAWGAALLAVYTGEKAEKTNRTLSEFLEQCIFLQTKDKVVKPQKDWVCGYEHFMQRYKEGLPIERLAATLT